jgi:putative membrane protein
MAQRKFNRAMLAWLGLLAGLGAIVAMVAWNGIGTVAQIISAGGWAVLLLSLYFIIDVAGSAISWRMLFARGRAPTLGVTVASAWMGSSVNALLPVANVGGEVVRARQVMRHGIDGAAAGASVIVDKTVQGLTVLLWGLVGLALLLGHTADRTVILGASAGFALMAAGIALLFLVQRLGVFGPAARAAAAFTDRAFWHELAGSAAALDGAIRATYARFRRFLCASGIKLATRVVVGTEVFAATLLMGHDIPLLDAFTICSLAVTARAIAFAIPSGLGAQEGAFVAVGALLGYPTELMLAISLATRLREILPYIPGLFALQFIEGRAFWRRRAARRHGAA